MRAQNRHAAQAGRHRRGFRVAAERFFLTVGAVLLAIFGAAQAGSWLIQAYAEWSFERALRLESASRGSQVPVSPPARPGPDTGSRDTSTQPGQEASAGMAPDGFAVSGAPEDRVPTRPPTAPETRPTMAIGRLQIPAIRLSAMVLDGDDAWSLNGAIGHVAGTAYPGEPGNSALAGHRDSFFRNLRKVTVGDTVIFTTLQGNFEYCVDEIKIVGPTSTWVLAPSLQPTLTLVTCFPFDYVGAAPRRFVVRARLLSQEGRGREGRLVESGAAGSGGRGDPAPAAIRTARNR